VVVKLVPVELVSVMVESVVLVPDTLVPVELVPDTLVTVMVKSVVLVPVDTLVPVVLIAGVGAGVGSCGSVKVELSE
jgi:hypothetical protein